MSPIPPFANRGYRTHRITVGSSAGNSGGTQVYLKSHVVQDDWYDDRKMVIVTIRVSRFVRHMALHRAGYMCCRATEESITHLRVTAVYVDK